LTSIFVVLLRAYRHPQFTSRVAFWVNADRGFAIFEIQ